MNQDMKNKTRKRKDQVLSCSDCDADNQCKSTREENNEIVFKFNLVY